MTVYKTSMLSKNALLGQLDSMAIDGLDGLVAARAELKAWPAATRVPDVVKASTKYVIPIATRPIIEALRGRSAIDPTAHYRQQLKPLA